MGRLLLLTSLGTMALVALVLLIKRRFSLMAERYPVSYTHLDVYKRQHSNYHQHFQ